MIRYKTVSTKKELEQILALQKTNLPNSLSSAEKKKEGFVTVHHGFDLLKRMNESCPHIIATRGMQVIGYTLCMHPKFGDEIEVLKSMFAEIENTSKPFKSFIIMGQVCVDKDYRKQGVFRELYNKMKETTSTEFEAIITEVDATNQRSLKAHYAIGFKTLSKYKGDGRDWELIYLK
jgi:predicted GNAT family N-acyltransferase